MKIFEFFKKWFSQSESEQSVKEECKPVGCCDWSSDGNCCVSNLIPPILFVAMDDKVARTFSGNETTLKYECKQLSEEELKVLNAERRTPEGKAKIKQQHIEMLVNKLNNIIEELKKLDVDANIKIKYEKE